MRYRRFAVYYLPPPGALSTFGATWFGWDVTKGKTVARPAVEGLADVTSKARCYGFHATLKPPFTLAEPGDVQALVDAVEGLAGRCAAAACTGLELSRLGRFLALTPHGETSRIDHVAERCVADLDRFRAPSDAATLARRRARGLSARQEALLVRWGYPHVMEAFRFHLTLTDRLQRSQIDQWQDRLLAGLPPLPEPFTIDEIALVGERRDGFFEEIQRFALTD